MFRRNCPDKDFVHRWYNLLEREDFVARGQRRKQFSIAHRRILLQNQATDIPLYNLFLYLKKCIYRGDLFRRPLYRHPVAIVLKLLAHIADTAAQNDLGDCSRTSRTLPLKTTWAWLIRAI